MKIDIIKIVDRGIPGKEGIWLRVMADCNLSYFAIIDTIYTTVNSISNLQKHAYWFGPKNVKSGDYVLIYTGKGSPAETKNNDGTTTHVLYWNLDRTIWNKQGDCAVLFELNSWQTSKYE